MKEHEDDNERKDHAHDHVERRGKRDLAEPPPAHVGDECYDDKRYEKRDHDNPHTLGP